MAGKMLAIGECMVELMQAEGGLLRKGYAGDTFNAAYYARLFMPFDWTVAYCSAVGADTISDEMLAFMAEKGVDTSAVRRIENETGHDAKPADIAAALNISLEEYHKQVQDSVSCRLFSFEQMANAADESPADYTPHEGPTPIENLEDDGFRGALAKAIDGLPEREKLVLSLYYDEEMNLREIGEVLEVSESRVCQIHGQALVRVRARMEEWLRP